jgi:hypothetical protein
MATAWSLSLIGGNNVREVLEKFIENVEDEDESDYFDLALENLQFTQDVPGYGMFDMLNAANIEEHTQVVDLSVPDDDADEEDDLSEDKLTDLD